MITQNLNHSKLVIYSTSKLENNKYFEEFKNFKEIEFKIFDIYDECKGTILEKSEYINVIKNHNVSPFVESDFVRILLLHKYGGVYVDFDVLFLRDFSPLLKYEFAYKWQDYSIGQLYVNGAILRVIKDSIISNQLIEEINNRNNYAMSWGSNTFQSVAMKNRDFIWTKFRFKFCKK